VAGRLIGRPAPLAFIGSNALRPHGTAPASLEAMAERSARARKQKEALEERPSDDNGSARGGPAQTKGGRAPGRGIWSGSISFGLLQIPVALYPAEQRAEEIHFRLLDKHDLSPIRYERVSSSTGKPVEWKDIVKGYELEPETFVVLDKEDLDKANVKKTQTIDIQDFVPADEIDPAFFDTPYFVVPQKRATKAYVLLREALRKMNAVAIATFVLRTREHLVALMPVGDAIMLEILRFGHELRHAEDMPLPSRAEQAIGKRELDMAEQLIKGMMTAWDPSKYRDRYYADVMKMIEEKAKTGTTRPHHEAVRGTVANDVVDLLALLKKSVEGKGGPKKARKRPSKRKTEAA
jgi:DNA end-binding protein Ku